MMVSAAGGGVIRTRNGAVLDIPPGALVADVQVTMTPLGASDLSPGWLAGVRLEPSGLSFKKPVILTLPLRQAAPSTNPPKHLEFFGDDPRRAYDSGSPVVLSPDGKSAILTITHFSGAICALNCHAGTMEFLTAQYRKRGLLPQDILACVQKKFPGIDLPTFCGRVTQFGIQPLLDTFFDQLEAEALPPGKEVASLRLAQLAAAAQSGRNVVFAFSHETPGGRTGQRGFYEDIDHTAALEMHMGRWQLRNTVEVGEYGLRLLGGTNLAWWPLDMLNAFRQQVTGVPVEVQVCGEPGCLSRTGEFDFENNHIYPALSARKVPWGGVRIYVERPGATDGCFPDGGVAPAPDARIDVPTTDAAAPDVTRSDATVDTPPLPLDFSGQFPDVPICPKYTRTGGYCAGENACPAGGATCACSGGSFCCIPGFCWTRYIAGCTQEKCPPMAGRNYTNHCTCPANTKSVYDSCRPGFLVSCDPP